MPFYESDIFSNESLYKKVTFSKVIDNDKEFWLRIKKEMI